MAFITNERTEMTKIAGKTKQEWIQQYPVIQKLIDLEVTDWFNPNVLSAKEGLAHVGLTVEDVDDAAIRLKRWAPYLAQVFPQTQKTLGILESPIVAVTKMQDKLDEINGFKNTGKLWCKLDSHLPISGSIKARGGIYEVLKYAEKLALEHGLITINDDYRKLDTPEARALFGKYKIAVGSTGNLGLSIGMMSARLGFQASVHMSADARQWKKDKLRSHGVTVVEHKSDYSVAVAQGRKEAEKDPSMYFVDDENSSSLFLGYAVAARRLAGQFKTYDVVVDEDHPLIAYLPCGVGGGPGGVAFGLKTVFGDNVKCIFAEPTHCPSMFLGVLTGEHDNVSVQDFGIDNLTAADGLACGRPSAFVGSRMQYLIDGYYTVTDETMYRDVALLSHIEDLQIEPSSATALEGAYHVLRNKQYLQNAGLTPERLANATHLAWITGGNMVPKDEMDSYISKGEKYI